MDFPRTPTACVITFPAIFHCFHAMRPTELCSPDGLPAGTQYYPLMVLIYRTHGDKCLHTVGVQGSAWSNLRKNLYKNNPPLPSGSEKYTR
ncbi:MAG: hypothetical protein IJT51_02590 [Bacteroidales bacterium]|nr:hypothetical protein [Bacteroidales bacterium]